MVRKGVSRIDSHIGIVARVETSMEPSTIACLDLEEMKPTILLSWLWPSVLVPTHLKIKKSFGVKHCPHSFLTWPQRNLFLAKCCPDNILVDLSKSNILFQYFPLILLENSSWILHSPVSRSFPQFSHVPYLYSCQLANLMQKYHEYPLHVYPKAYVFCLGAE